MSINTRFFRRLGGLTAATGALLTIPAASAASLPLLGEFDIGFNIGFGLIVAGIAMALAATAVGASFFKRIPFGRLFVSGGAVGAVVLLLVAAYVNPGGMFNSDDSPASFTSSPSASFASATSAGYDPLRYEPVSAVTFSVAALATKSGTGLSPSIKLYTPGVTEKAAFEGTATPHYTGTATDGSLTLSGVQVQTIGCSVDVLVDLSGYYQKIAEKINVCREKNPNGLNAVYPPTIFIEKVGTASLGLTPTSLTCSAGSQCSYSLVIRNTAADTYLNGLAVKFTNVANATLDSSEGNQGCELLDVSGTQYVKFSQNIGPAGTLSCNVKLTRASGSADGSWTWIMDDNFQKLGATAWNTHSLVRGATVTGATTVTFA